VKKWVMTIITRFYQRYGVPKLAEEGVMAFAKVFHSQVGRRRRRRRKKRGEGMVVVVVVLAVVVMLP